VQRIGDGWRAVRLLSLTSLLADVSGEMLMAVLPFLVVAQGATGLAVGLVGASSEAVGNLAKWLGGRWGDRVRHKRGVVAAGYLVAALSRFGIAWGTTWRSADRVGKGIRTAPRDAMLAAAVPREERGRAFAYHRTADTAGAVIGVLAVIAMLRWTAWSLPQIVLVAAVVGLAATLPLLALREPEMRPAATTPDLGRPQRGFAAFVSISCVFAAGQVSYLFYLLRAGGNGILGAVAWYLLFNVVYAAASYPFGIAADRWGKPIVLVAGFALTAAASLLMAPDPGPMWLGLGFVTLGFAFAATEGTGRAIAADLAGSKTSTHLGTYHAAIGIAALAGGAVGGLVWDRYGPATLFAGGSAFVLVALIGLLAWMRRPAPA